MTSKDLIYKLQLQPHPEGGYYRETYRSGQKISLDSGKERNVCTAIFYLLEDHDFSAFHRIKSDELWFFHHGEPLEIVSIQDGKLMTLVLGNAIDNGEVFQAAIPANTWFAARIKDGSGFSLVSCTVAPGFDFADFELADRSKLTLEFPHLKDIIEAFTK